MKKLKVIFALVFFIILIQSCNKHDDCATILPAYPYLFVKLVDVDGNNLIENGTIDPNEIVVLSDGNFRVNTPDGSDSDLDYTLELFIPSELTFQYVLQLNDTETITMDFTSEINESDCFTIYVPTGAIYNNQALELSELYQNIFLTEIEL